MKGYIVIDPNGKHMTIQEYMDTDHFQKMLDKKIEEYLNKSK